jgi:hypothetical protein
VCNKLTTYISLLAVGNGREGRRGEEGNRWNTGVSVLVCSRDVYRLIIIRITEDLCVLLYSQFPYKFDISNTDHAVMLFRSFLVPKTLE